MPPSDRCRLSIPAAMPARPSSTLVIPRCNSGVAQPPAPAPKIVRPTRATGCAWSIEIAKIANPMNMAARHVSTGS
ncbi:Uncharacterised protein [Mycobacterium tuberculosis]|nr:Uncharacterised protein [Mycobacterium tuberculosis]